jgi:hypothetical protein
MNECIELRLLGQEYFRLHFKRVLINQFVRKKLRHPVGDIQLEKIDRLDTTDAEVTDASHCSPEADVSSAAPEFTAIPAATLSTASLRAEWNRSAILSASPSTYLQSAT